MSATCVNSLNSRLRNSMPGNSHLCNSMLRNCVIVGVLVLLQACEQKPPLEIEQLHINALPPGQTTAAAYMILRNNTKTTLVLNYAHSPIASDVEVHRVIYDQGMMQMRKVNHLSIDPGSVLHFQPGGYHLMLMGIENAPPVGDSFTITFEFEAGYTISADAEVRSLSQ